MKAEGERAARRRARLARSTGRKCTRAFVTCIVCFVRVYLFVSSLSLSLLLSLFNFYVLSSSREKKKLKKEFSLCASLSLSLSLWGQKLSQLLSSFYIQALSRVTRPLESERERTPKQMRSCLTRVASSTLTARSRFLFLQRSRQQPTRTGATLKRTTTSASEGEMKFTVTYSKN